MNNFLLWATGIALVIGVGSLTNAWLGLAAGGAWALYVRRTRRPNVSSLGGRESRAYALRERIDRMNDAAADDPFLFFIGSVLILALADQVVLGGSLRRSLGEQGWRMFLTWTFWIVTGVAFFLAYLLLLVFFFLYRTWGRIRYAEFDTPLPFLEHLTVRAGVLAWGDLHLHMSPDEAAEAIGYESIMETDDASDGDGTHRMRARYLDRDVSVFWDGASRHTRIAEIALTLKELEASVDKELCLTRIRKKLPILKDKNGELWLHANGKSAVHVSKYEGGACVHLIRRDATS
jgi:hypothetical protein